MSNILFELGTEELPPKALNTLAQNLYDGVVTQLDKAEISFDKDSSRWFASPRRLAFILSDIDKTQANKTMQRRGPAVDSAFDDYGKPKPAAIGFAKSVGAAVADLEFLKTDKGEWLVYDVTEVGKNTSELIADFIQTSIKKLPTPKPMRWGNNSFHFIRPVHWLLLLQDSEVIPFKMFGLTSSNQSRGHRFHAPNPITIKSAATYVQQLLDARVEVDNITRKESIKQQVLKVAKSIHGIARCDDDLLDEVTAIVEHPVALVGSFDEDFLQVPPEVLTSSMQKHQKYFPIFDSDNKLMANFVALANIESNDAQQVIKGFERVIRPRLADARFFWEQDQKQPLANNFAMLEKMTFEKQLGSIGDKCQRIAKIMQFIAQELDLDIAHAKRASYLLKCDLVTDMVAEFPDLQGIMGGYYAATQNEDIQVAQALTTQYQPRFAGDKIPATPLAQALAIADKMDTLCGIFAVGKKPTGNKDPFALRRAAIGVIKILQKGKLELSLQDLISICLKQIELQDINRQKIQIEIEDFIINRLKHNYLEQNIEHDVVEAVLASNATLLYDIDERIIACQNFKHNQVAPALAAANKRISNILKKSAEKIPKKVAIILLEQEQEKNLYGAIESIKRRFKQEVSQHKYSEAFVHLATLAQPVDKFFDNIMVNSEEKNIRLNRLAILKRLNNLFNAIANISLLEI